MQEQSGKCPLGEYLSKLQALKSKNAKWYIKSQYRDNKKNWSWKLLSKIGEVSMRNILNQIWLLIWLLSLFFAKEIKFHYSQSFFKVTDLNSYSGKTTWNQLSETAEISFLQHKRPVFTLVCLGFQKKENVWKSTATVLFDISN